MNLPAGVNNQPMVFVRLLNIDGSSGSGGGTVIDNVSINGTLSCDLNLMSAIAMRESCGGEGDGSISITATSSNPIIYSIDNGGSFVSTNTFMNLTAGTYDVVVQDQGDATCQQTTQVTIMPGPTIDPPTVVNETIDCGDPAPTLTATCDDTDCDPCSFDPSTMTIAVSFSGNHTYVSDLSFYIQGPSGCTTPLLTLAPYANSLAAGFQGNCNSGDDFSNLVFTNDPGAGNFSVCGAATPFTGTFNAAYGNTINWSALAGCDIYETGWQVIVGDCVSFDFGDLDRIILTITDNGGTSCLGAGGSVVYDSGVTDLNEPLNDNECEPGTDNPATFAVNIPNQVMWYSSSTGGTAIGEGSSFNVAGTTAEEGAFDSNTAGTYTYYAECACQSCTSDRAPVTVTVNSCCDLNLVSAIAMRESCGGEGDGSISITATSSNPIIYSIDNGGSFVST
ncbi:MAG: hypothetical protein AAGJ82_01525, partial [Bacteroidota bacterium]